MRRAMTLAWIRAERPSKTNAPPTISSRNSWREKIAIIARIPPRPNAHWRLAIRRLIMMISTEQRTNDWSNNGEVYIRGVWLFSTLQKEEIQQCRCYRDH